MANVVIKSVIQDVDMQIEDDDANTTYTTLYQPPPPPPPLNSIDSITVNSGDSTSPTIKRDTALKSSSEVHEASFEPSFKEEKRGDSPYGVTLSPPAATLKISHLPTSNSGYSSRLTSFFSHFKPKRVKALCKLLLITYF
jgi:hypothetical protein